MNAGSLKIIEYRYVVLVGIQTMQADEKNRLTDLSLYLCETCVQKQALLWASRRRRDGERPIVNVKRPRILKYRFEARGWVEALRVD